MSIPGSPALTEDPKRSFAASVVVAKDVLSLLRDLCIFVLALLLLAFPERFNAMLTSAGFEEGSIVGLKWKGKLLNADVALKEALVTITDLRSQLTTATQTIADLQRKGTDPTTSAEVGKALAAAQQATQSAGRVASSVSNTIERNADSVEQAAMQLAPGAEWAIVYSGDTSLEGAKYEVTAIASKYRLPNPRIYLRQGSYRSVSVTSSRVQAEDVLARAKQRRRDAYIVTVSTWCPKAIAREGYIECE